jgi:hypothetical protein
MCQAWLLPERVVMLRSAASCALVLGVATFTSSAWAAPTKVVLPKAEAHVAPPARHEASHEAPHVAPVKSMVAPNEEPRLLFTAARLAEAVVAVSPGGQDALTEHGHRAGVNGIAARSTRTAR